MLPNNPKILSHFAQALCLLGDDPLPVCGLQRLLAEGAGRKQRKISFNLRRGFEVVLELTEALPLGLKATLARLQLGNKGTAFLAFKQQLLLVGA